MRMFDGSMFNKQKNIYEVLGRPIKVDKKIRVK